MNLSSLGVSEIWLKFKKHTKEQSKEQSSAAKKKLAMANEHHFFQLLEQ